MKPHRNAVTLQSTATGSAAFVPAGRACVEGPWRGARAPLHDAHRAIPACASVAEQQPAGPDCCATRSRRKRARLAVRRSGPSCLAPRAERLRWFETCAWSARAARCPACPIRLHRHPFDHDAPPLRGHAARTLLASALAVSSLLSHAASPAACLRPIRCKATAACPRSTRGTATFRRRPACCCAPSRFRRRSASRAPAASCASSMHRPTASAAARRSPCRVRCSCRAARRRPAAGRSSRGRTARSGWPTSARRRGSAARIATCAT